jgi:hypothetical protein
MILGMKGFSFYPLTSLSVAEGRRWIDCRVGVQAFSYFCMDCSRMVMVAVVVMRVGAMRVVVLLVVLVVLLVVLVMLLVVLVALVVVMMETPAAAAAAIEVG